MLAYVKDELRAREVVRLCRDALSIIAEMEDLDAAVASANRLSITLRDQADAAAALRSEIIGKIWNQEKLSLAALANRVGISKARADQLTRKYLKEREMTDG